MNADQAQIINDLKSSINLLIAKIEKEKSEQIRLKSSNLELQRRVNMQDARLNDLEQKYTNLKIAKSLIAESGNVHEAKIKVNRIVREIDKCIALLNR
jgi:hypothetical protein